MKYYNEPERVKINLEDNLRYKLLIVSENNLVAELDGQVKLGFELFSILDKINPDSSSDFSGYKILLRSIKR